MSAVVLLKWQFSPPEYFEGPIEISRDDYVMTVADGKVEARVDSAIYDANTSMRKVLQDALSDRFLGIQLLTHRAYELSNSTMSRVYPDGGRDNVIELEPARLVLTAYTPDIRVADKNGNVVSDSKQDRITKKRSLGELVTKYRVTDELLAALLGSHSAAVRDPNNELVHLYEIKEALCVKFCGESAATAALGITSWRRLRQLCNDKSLRQGRHRGGSGGALRDATEAELAEARGIARAMIEAYLQHLKASDHARNS